MWKDRGIEPVAVLGHSVGHTTCNFWEESRREASSKSLEKWLHTSLLNDVSVKHGLWFHLGILNSFGCCGWKHGFSDSGVCKASGKGSLLRNDHQTPDHFLPNHKNPPNIHGKISAQGNQKKFGFIDAKKSPNINHSLLKDNNLAVPSTEPEGIPGHHHLFG